MTEVLGWVAALFATVLALPQAVRLIRTRQVAGIPLVAWQFQLGLNIGWAVHGWLIEQINMVLPNLLAGVTAVVVLSLMRRELDFGWLKVFWPAPVVGASLVLIDLALGSAVFGVVAVIPALVLNGAQSVSLVRSPSVDGVSPAYLALLVANQVAWTVWAVLVWDVGTVVAAGVTGVVCLFNLLWWIARAAGLGPLGGQVGIDLDEATILRP